MSFWKGVAKILDKISQFIKSLFNRHGDVSTSGTISRTQKILPDTSSDNLIINIADTKTWEKFRETALTLNVLTDFFKNHNDEQSPHFLNSIEQYKKSLEKKLVTPQEIDENASYIFADKLAHAIKKRFYPILRSCKRGLTGKGELSADYYESVENAIKTYFESIGLESLNIKTFSNFSDYAEYMKPTNVSTENPRLDKLISEIEIQPHYFEYYNEHGDIEKFWLDGECSVFVFKDL